MKYKENWDAARQKWANYWKHQNTGRPLMCVIARKPEIEEAYRHSVQAGIALPVVRSQGFHTSLPDSLMYQNMEEKYQNASKMIDRYRHFCDTHTFYAESFPNINTDFGPGSVAAYIASDIVFSENSVWFTETIEDWDGVPPFSFNPENAWWKKHFQLVKDIRNLVKEDFYVQMPDLMEGLDVLASLRGTENLVYDLMDYPEEIEKRIREVNQINQVCYENMYPYVENSKDGGNCYTVFQIWGPGKTAKLQCDFSVMMSPNQFREMALEPLRQQAKQLDRVLYHLDGPDSIRHMDALMEIDEIDALQWTSGDHGPDGTLEEWDIIYDKARAAGKSIWVKVYSGQFEDWVRNADRLVKRYGSHSLFFHFPEMSTSQAETLLEYAEKNWTDIEGTFSAK